jgi:DNA-binding MarR family transcriptional regulator
VTVAVARRRFGVATRPGAPDAANLLGALALAVTDGLDDCIDVVGSGGRPVAAALVTLDTGPAFNVGDLARVLGLSHAGTVRVVDRMEHSGWVRRERGADARSVVLSLTPEGKAVRERLSDRRMSELRRLLDRLDSTEQALLGELAGKLLRSIAVDPVRAYAVCRLCTTEACTPYGCPVEQGCCAALAATGP